MDLKIGPWPPEWKGKVQRNEAARHFLTEGAGVGSSTDRKPGMQPTQVHAKVNRGRAWWHLGV